MHGKWLALTLSALPAFASAESTLYGRLQGNVGRNTITQGPGSNAMEDTYSRLGFKGSEALGDGLRAIWQVELSTPLSGAPRAPEMRETFVGFDADTLGRLRIGTINSAVNDLYAVNDWQSAGGLKHSARSARATPYLNTGASGLAPLTNAGNRITGAIRYDTPRWAGLSANALYAPGKNRTPDRQGTPGVRHASDIASIGLGYTWEGLFANYAWQRESNPLGVNLAGDRTARSAQPGGQVSRAALHYLEAGYRDDHWLVAAAYQYSRGYDWTDSFSGDSHSRFATPDGYRSAAQIGLKNRQAALTIAHAFGAWRPKLSLARGWNQQAQGQAIPDSGYRQVLAGVDYRLSKRTVAGLAFGRLHFDRNASAAVNQQPTTLNAGVVGLQHDF